MFEKGKSGNPAGRPKTTEEFKKKLKEGTTGALDVLLDMMENGEIESNRLAAAKVILEKALGSNYRLFENDGEVEDSEITVKIVNAKKTKENE